MNTWQIYFLLKLDDLRWMLGVVSFVIWLVVVILLLLYFFYPEISSCSWFDYADKSPVCKKIFFLVVPVALFCTIVTVAIPTTKEAVIIYLAPKIIKVVQSNEKVENITNNTLDLIDDWIKKMRAESYKQHTE